MNPPFFLPLPPLSPPPPPLSSIPSIGEKDFLSDSSSPFSFLPPSKLVTKVRKALLLCRKFFFGVGLIRNYTASLPCYFLLDYPTYIMNSCSPIGNSTFAISQKNVLSLHFSCYDMSSPRHKSSFLSPLPPSATMINEELWP